MVLPYRKHIRNASYPWIVFINGLFTDQDSWSEVVDSVDEFNILTYDSRGQGNAPVIEGTYSLDDQVNDLLELIKHTKIDNLYLIGLSNGGRIALKFASHYPEYIKALVACDTYGTPSTLLKLKIESWLKAHQKGGAVHRFDVATPWVWGEALLESKPELVEIYREKSKKTNDKNIVGLIEGALTGSVDLKSVKSPTLLIVGDEDLLTPINHHRKMAKSIPDSEVAVVNGGHASLIEHPEIFLETIVPFLRRHNELG